MNYCPAPILIVICAVACCQKHRTASQFTFKLQYRFIKIVYRFTGILAWNFLIDSAVVHKFSAGRISCISKYPTLLYAFFSLVDISVKYEFYTLAEGSFSSVTFSIITVIDLIKLYDFKRQHRITKHINHNGRLSNQQWTMMYALCISNEQGVFAFLIGTGIHILHSHYI